MKVLTVKHKIMISNLFQAIVNISLFTLCSASTINLLSTVNPDGSIRTNSRLAQECVPTIFGLSGNSHLEIVPCLQYGKEKISYDMKFSYDSIKKTIESDSGLCWNINGRNGLVNLKPCRNLARNSESKQIFHVMRNETSRILVPGGQYAGMCVGYENSDAMFSEGMKLVTVFDCDMTGYSIDRDF